MGRPSKMLLMPSRLRERKWSNNARAWAPKWGLQIGGKFQKAVLNMNLPKMLCCQSGLRTPMDRPAVTTGAGPNLGEGTLIAFSRLPAIRLYVNMMGS